MHTGAYQLDVTCDTEGCPYECSYLGDNKRQAWQEAREEGWKRRGDKCYCRKCKPPKATRSKP